MEKMVEARLSLFNEVKLPNDDDLNAQEKRAFRGMIIFSSMFNDEKPEEIKFEEVKQEVKLSEEVINELQQEEKQDDPVEPKLVEEIRKPTDWVTAKKCKRGKKF